MCYGDYTGKQDLEIFLRSVKARAEQISREEAYRICVTESLRIIPQQRWFTKSYLELLKPQQIETRSGKEVAEEVAEKLGTKIDWGR